MRVKLSELGTVITGNTPSKQEQKYWTSSDIPFIKPDIISQNEITELQSANEYVSDAARSKARIVGKGVVLVTCIGTIGKICLTGRECAFNQQINAIVPNEKVLPEYLAYCIYYNRYKLAEIANAPVVPIINKSQFEEFYVSIEKDVELQRKILLILRRASALVSYRQHQLQKLDELVKARFVEMFGEPKSNKSNLVKIEEIGSLTSGGTPSRIKPEYFKGDIRWYSAGELNSLYLPDSVEHISKTALKESAAKLFNKGTLMIGMYDTAAFKLGILTEDSSSNQACANLNPQNDYNVVWLYYLFDIMKPVFLQERQGVRQKNLSLSKIKEFEVPSAPIGIQNQFAAFVERVNKSKAAVQKALDEAQLLFDSLMQKYFE